MKKPANKVKDKSSLITTKEYTKTLSKIKKQIKDAQVKAFHVVNKEMLKLYWSIGKIVFDRQEEDGWGANVIEKLANDLKQEFPGMNGFSRTNIFYMRSFYIAYKDEQNSFGQLEDLPIFDIPWWHNVILITKLKDNAERLWYAQKTLEHGWSGNILGIWVKSDLYHREGKAVSNFKKTLPSPHSDLAQQSFKDPYIFDFLTLREDHIEHDLEQGLIDNVQRLLLEMGKGFALVGRQYHLTVDNKDYYIDLLFYHFKLRCFVVVELKAREFSAADVGQLNFYLSAVDDLVRSPEDKPTIGLLLCKTKQNITAEYALRGLTAPIGVAEYETEILKHLPKELKSSLPTIEEIEAELEKNELLDEEELSEIKKARKKL